jgi:hypothetical protein
LHCVIFKYMFRATTKPSRHFQLDLVIHRDQPLVFSNTFAEQPTDLGPDLVSVLNFSNGTHHHLQKIVTSSRAIFRSGSISSICFSRWTSKSMDQLKDRLWSCKYKYPVRNKHGQRVASSREKKKRVTSQVVFMAWWFSEC